MHEDEKLLDEYLNIAIIGGGSAGLVTAHLLDGTHRVTLFEKAPILGGHVRSLGRNVDCDLGPGLILDAGVIEFERNNFPTLMRLFDSLGCVTRAVPGTTTFWTHDGVHHLSPGSIKRTEGPLRVRLRQLIDLLELRMQGVGFNRRTGLPETTLDTLTLGDLLTDADADRWAALLATYAYSIPYERVRQMPAGLTIPMLRAFERAESWLSLRGGSWDYLGRIVERLSGTLHTDAHVARVARNERGVTVHMASGEAHLFDKIVFAAPPDQTLALLEDPTENERRRFGAWRANHIHTLVHHDRSVYGRRGLEVMTEFDVIETEPGKGGYNCYLNVLCGVPANEERAYGLAFGIDAWIDPKKVIRKQEHHTPDYTVESQHWHHEVSASNGENHTFHAGAWLGDGLQEGAVTSAVAVSKLLGGASIP
ncbi:MAG: FAD-dependent oxidoreductase [Deltaproteobacteria bacterium]|nr:FAD-dependent oxidoreductase [Deltaproteobacteria bacterium]